MVGLRTKSGHVIRSGDRDTRVNTVPRCRQFSLVTGIAGPGGLMSVRATPRLDVVAVHVELPKSSCENAVRRGCHGVSDRSRRRSRLWWLRYERPNGVVDRDDKPGRGSRRQTTVTRRSVLTVSGQAVTGFVERVGDPVPLGDGRRILPPGRPVGGRGARRDGRAMIRPPARGGRSRALDRRDVARASNRDAQRAEPRAQRGGAAAGVRRSRGPDGAERQSGPAGARCRWRCWTSAAAVPASRWPTRLRPSSRSRRCATGILRRPARSGAARARARRRSPTQGPSTRRARRPSGR